MNLMGIACNYEQLEHGVQCGKGRVGDRKRGQQQPYKEGLYVSL